jgi:hypothetical protein
MGLTAFLEPEKISRWSVSRVEGPAGFTAMATTADSTGCFRTRHPAVGNGDHDAGGRARWQGALGRLAEMSEAELAAFDIARLNLFCAAGLPGSEGIDPDACLEKLDAWAKYIGGNIERWWPRFLTAPGPGEDSPGKFRMMAVATLLQRQLGVHYNMPFTEGDYDGRDSRNLLLHGLLTGCGGTCVTLPVLTIAVGRRLGCPLWLVKTKDHYFARWDEPGVERFNVECACRGFASHSDEYYRRWRTPISDAEVRSGAFLCNLTPREELAHFLKERSHCLIDHLRIPEALEALYHAHKMAPHDGGIRGSWIVASVMQRTLQRAMRAADRRNTQRIAIERMEYPPPRDAAEAWALPYARETFARILRIQGRKGLATPAA